MTLSVKSIHHLLSPSLVPDPDPFLPFLSLSPENASSDQTAGADPDHPDSTDPGRGARDDPERVRRHPLVLQRRRQHVPLQKRGKVTLYAYVGLPGTLWAGTSGGRGFY